MTSKRMLPISAMSNNSKPKDKANCRVLPINTMQSDEAIVSVLPINILPDDMTTTAVLTKTHVSEDEDKRPEPKPRKLLNLWQAYLWWFEIMEMRKRHNLRISSIKRGKSNMDAQFEQDMLEEMQIETLLKLTKKNMINFGKATGPIWDWLTSIRGLGSGSLAAQLLAQIDDIENSPTVASLWRFAGFAVIDGKAEKNEKGKKSKFNRKLKGICFNIAEQFIKQQTPGYVDIYYEEKARLREKYPEPIPKEEGSKVKLYTDAHLHNRAWRKMIKTFLKDLWVEWKGI